MASSRCASGGVMELGALTCCWFGEWEWDRVDGWPVLY